LDPHVSYYQFDYWILYHSAETLLWYNRESPTDIIPWLAESYTVSEDGLHYEFKLRKSITFQDGTPFNATAVWFNLNRLLIIDGTNVTKAGRRQLHELRKKMQIIFQDPYASLDPRQTVNSMLLEAMKIHGVASSRAEASKRALETLNKVGLSEEHLYRFPHEFSGGQRQRIALARVLLLKPKFIILDEPTSFLDVSVQASVLNLLKDLQREFDLTYLFISHNLAVVHHMSDRVAVMYLGKIVEFADKNRIYHSPLHPYTFHFMDAIPLPDPEARKEHVLLPGDVPSPVNVPPGCRFHPRCPYATEKCRKEEPKLLERDRDHWVACHYEIDFKAVQTG